MVGAAPDLKFHNNPLHPVAMARKKRMYKSVNMIKAENIGHTGGRYLLAYVEKQQDSFTSAWLEKLRVSFHMNSSDDLASANRPAFFGGQFLVTTQQSAVPDSDNLITATGFNGFGGTCTLSVKRAIRDNAEDTTEGDGRLYLWVETTDLNLQAGDITGDFTIECHGRWQKLVSA